MRASVYNGSHGFHCALEFIVNFPGHFEENLDTGTKLLFPGRLASMSGDSYYSTSVNHNPPPPKG